MRENLDREFMGRAIRLAWRGHGRVEPNPMVGAVVASGEEVLGEGWHDRFGGPHAEVVALRAAGDRVRGATLYVTLEPCCHEGKTPPCTDLILSSGLSRVVVGTVDPNPVVSGRGLAMLKEKRLDLEVGVLQEEARDLIRCFSTWVQRGVPYGYAKWAMTLDGRIATRTGDARWVSGPESRELVHELRSEVDAILIGRGTVTADDPLLTARIEGGRNPLRVVLDSTLEISEQSQLVRTAGEVPLVVATTERASGARRAHLESKGVEMVVFDDSDGRVDLLAVGRWLGGSRGVSRLLYEGGSEVLASAFEQELIDECWVFVAPKVVGGRGAPGPVGGMGFELMAQALSIHNLRCETIGEDQLFVGRVERPETTDAGGDSI